MRGLGQSSGVTAELLNTGSLTREQFKARVNQFLDAARDDPVLAGVRQNALDDSPTLKVDFDAEKIGALGLAQTAVDQTLTTAWGGTYVDDFIDRGRVKRVYVQGDALYRSRPEDSPTFRVAYLPIVAAGGDGTPRSHPKLSR